MTLGQAFISFWVELFTSLPVVLPRMALAWLATFIVLTAVFRWLKTRIRRHLLHWDNQLRHWALNIRYANRAQKETERLGRTWFFRFWTNFASAPSLLTLSVVFPIWVYWKSAPGTPLESLNIFFLPGLAFCGSMLMSYVTKRVFKRVRPHREFGSFGHKMKDGSFPSGHSLTSWCFWSMLAVAVAAFGAPAAVTAAMFALALVITLLTGLSRVYLGVHFPSDVFGGYTIGAVWSVVCYFFLLPVL